MGSANVDYSAKRWKEAAQLWEPLAKYKIAADTAARAAAVAERDKQVAALQWGAERKTEAIKTALDHHATTLNNITKGIADNQFDLGDPTNLGIYTEAFNRYIKTQRDYYGSVGYEGGTGDTITHLTPFFNSIFDDWEKKNPDGDPATLKWGREKDVWGDVVKRLDPSINRDDAHIVWEKIWTDKFGSLEKKKAAASDPLTHPVSKLFEKGLSPLSEGLGLLGEAIVPSDPKESWSQALGAPVDIITGAMRPFGYSEEKPFMGSEWFSDKLSPSDRDKPVITPSSSYTAAGPFAGTQGLISGISDFMKREAIMEESGMPKAQDIKTLQETTKTLEEVESDAQKREVREELPPAETAERDISAEAASFLTKLLEYMVTYGPEEARSILSQEFSDLSSSAKNELQKYLESEALA